MKKSKYNAKDWMFKHGKYADILYNSKSEEGDHFTLDHTAKNPFLGDIPNLHATSKKGKTHFPIGSGLDAITGFEHSKLLGDLELKTEHLYTTLGINEFDHFINKPVSLVDEKRNHPFISKDSYKPDTFTNILLEQHLERKKNKDLSIGSIETYLTSGKEKKKKERYSFLPLDIIIGKNKPKKMFPDLQYFLESKKKEKEKEFDYTNFLNPLSSMKSKPTYNPVSIYQKHLFESADPGTPLSFGMGTSSVSPTGTLKGDKTSGKAPYLFGKAKAEFWRDKAYSIEADRIKESMGGSISSIDMEKSIFERNCPRIEGLPGSGGLSLLK